MITIQRVFSFRAVSALLQLFLLSLVFPPTGAHATKYAGEFMAFGGGARALGMGGAFISVADDASTVFWNPAGISGFEKRQALFMHSERFGDLVNYNFGSFVMPTTLFSSSEREGALGFAVIHLGVDDIPITNNLKWEERNGIPGFQPNDGDRLEYDESQIPKESSNEFAFLGSYAMRTSYGRIGGTLKILYTNSIAGYSSTGIGIDLAFLKKNLYRNLSAGVKLQDATGTYIGWSSGTNEFIAPTLKLGTSYVFHSKELKGSLLVAVDGDIYFENRKWVSQFWMGKISADIHFGAELCLQEKVMVRGGIDAGNATAGAGLRLGFLGFDYAYLHHDRFEATHRVSALANF